MLLFLLTLQLNKKVLMKIKKTLLYNLYESPLKDKEGNKYIQVRAMASKETMSYNEIKDYIIRNTSLGVAELEGVPSALRDAILTFLPQSKRIHIGGLGYFYLKLKFKDKKRVTDKKGIKSSDIAIDNLEFLPEASLINELRSLDVHFKNYNILNSDNIDKDLIQKKLKKYFKTNNSITIKKFQTEFNTTRYMASLILKDLASGENPLLTIQTMGKLNVFSLR